MIGRIIILSFALELPKTAATTLGLFSRRASPCSAHAQGVPVPRAAARTVQKRSEWTAHGTLQQALQGVAKSAEGRRARGNKDLNHEDGDGDGPAMGPIDRQEGSNTQDGGCN
mmetsp:Transcript_46019/g.120572  ORF Transcript_46019/g.120572 Transcript_46019/m.120572 type:complete len:113 (+) Transcript_46019:290-628(+)